MTSFRCYDNSDVIATRNKFSSLSNTTVVTIFPNVCLWRRSLGSNLKNCIEPLHMSVHRMALVFVRLFCKNLSKLQEFFGQMV